MSEAEYVVSQLDQQVLTITLNRPRVNALNLQMVSELQDAFERARVDKQVRCVVLTARGATFSAGHDLFEMIQQREHSMRYHLMHTYNPLILVIRRLEMPVLAAINGTVSGAALGIVLACDLRIASQNARFVVGFSGIGLVPDSGVSLLLPALVGLGRASEFTFSNQAITAEQALAWGLVNEVVPAGDLLERSIEWASKLGRGPVNAFALTKRAFNKAILANLEQVLDYEAHLQQVAGGSTEHREGVRAFLEKRSPDFLSCID